MPDRISSSKPVVVLGMHRSGTSALTRLINLLGVELGPNLMPASKDNEKGYWEHSEIVSIHERILSSLGSAWWDTRPLPPEWWLLKEIQPFRSEIISVIRRDFRESSLWGFKDPRTCRLLPMWHSIFHELGCNPSFIIVHRHPHEIAASLGRRDGFSREKSLLLWIYHILTAEKYTKGMPRVFVAYEDLLSDWRRISDRIAQALGLRWPNEPASIAHEAESFISPELRHHIAEGSGSAKPDDEPPWIDILHKALLSGSSKTSDDISETLSAVQKEFESARRLFWPMAEDHAACLKKNSRPTAKRHPSAPNEIRIELKQKNNLRASIIIPVYNKLELTRKCLESIIKNTPHGIYEIIIIDNASTDGTAEYLSSLSKPYIKVITNTENIGFARACNQGAIAASSDYLLFLNNDTEPLHGWLDPLLETLDKDDTVAAVGSKLLFPDNTIQHAGVVIIEDRKNREPIVAVHAHYRKPADFPQANRPLTYQALTAACLLIRAGAFHEAGGFDEDYWNGYEDVDLCFSLGSRGWNLIYQPKSVLIHHESQSGPERFSKSHHNIDRLIDKWAGRVKPDMIIEKNGDVTAGPAGRVRPYDGPGGVPIIKATATAGIKKGLVSIVLLTYNGLRYTKECIESIMRHTPEEHEIVFVDNGSTDSTVKWLKQVIKNRPNYRLIENKKNLGFAKGCNQGIIASRGEYILLLNNDTVVTDGWLSGMMDCLNSKDDIGIVGPMTNNISGIQRLPRVPYTSTAGLDAFSRDFRARNRYRRIPSGRIVGFCMLFKRALIDRTGLLDERFGSGNFEDDDFCLRARLEGFRNVIAGDVFIHHYGSRSFIENRIDYGSAIAENKSIFSEKWSSIDHRSAFGKGLIFIHAVEKAEDLYAKGMVDEAVSALLEGMEFVRDDHKMRYALAEILMDNRQFKEAKDVISPIQNESHIRRSILMGYCHAGLEEYNDAEREAEYILARDPRSAEGLNLKGVIAYGSGDRAQAREFFEKAIDADPGYGEPFTNLGILSWAEGKKEEALKLIERGFILSPTLSDNVSAYHAAVTETIRFQEAEAVFEEALAIHPNSRKIAFFLIDILLKQEKFMDATDRIEDAMLRFGIDDGMLAAATEVRRRIGPRKIPLGHSKRGTVSLCMIVRDEEKHIAKCLSSAKAVSGEIIVVDTGSTDRTKKIAESFGALVYDFAWTDDFSAARNFSISKASGDWILVLDADEVIAPSDYIHIRKLTDSRPKRPVAYRFTTRNYVHTVNVTGWIKNDGKYMEEAGAGWFAGKKVRLFPRDERIRFENPVHELVEPSLKRAGVEIKDCDVPIHHYGKLDISMNASKGLKYYEMLKRKLDEKKYDPSALRELAVQAGEIGRYEEAIGLWEDFLRLRPDDPEALMNIGAIYIQMGKLDEGLEFSKKAAGLRPDMKEAVLNQSICELCIGALSEAKKLLESMMKKEPTYPSGMAMCAAIWIIEGAERKGLEMLERLKHMGYDIYDFLSVNAERLRSAGRGDYASRLMAVMNMKLIPETDVGRRTAAAHA